MTFEKYEWMDDMNCVGIDMGYERGQDVSKFDGNGEYLRQLKAVCGRCDVRTQCLEYAMKKETGVSSSWRSGIYGGLTPSQRAKLARQYELKGTRPV